MLVSPARRVPFVWQRLLLTLAKDAHWLLRILHCLSSQERKRHLPAFLLA